ncbi:hypothetical protein V4D30_07980 [Thermodesulfovibrio sp. 3907-1M]|uniref:Membrane transporter protein n=1 Tax=Thermodesulfovibrio autotrophicus TaxID=3118333 RepID=A0AAU8GXH5_9BACT
MLLPHLSTAHWNFSLTVALIAAGALFSFLGARVTSIFVPGVRVKQIFAVLILIVTGYKIYTLIF